MVETTIDLSELSRHEFVIKADFDDSLRETRDKLEEVRDGLNEEHLSVANDLGMDPEGKVLHFEIHSMYGHCFRLTRKVGRTYALNALGAPPLTMNLRNQEASAIKGKKGYIELKNQTNGMFFTTKTLKALNEENSVLKKEYDKKQSMLVKEVIAIAGQSRVREGLYGHGR